MHHLLVKLHQVFFRAVSLALSYLSILSWSPHVDHIRNKVNHLLGFLKWNLLNASTQIKQYACKKLLLPFIECCSAIWDSFHHSDANKLEMIQHYAAHFILNKPWHRQQQNDRRKISHLILLFKIMLNLLICSIKSLSPDFCPTRECPCSSYAQACPYSRIEIYRYSFLPRTMALWNNLDIQDIEQISLTTRKDNLLGIL